MHEHSEKTEIAEFIFSLLLANVNNGINYRDKYRGGKWASLWITVKLWSICLLITALKINWKSGNVSPAIFLWKNLSHFQFWHSYFLDVIGREESKGEITTVSLFAWCLILICQHVPDKPGPSLSTHFPPASWPEVDVTVQDLSWMWHLNLITQVIWNLLTAEIREIWRVSQSC